MSEVFVARQPIFDTADEVVGYELLFRGGNRDRTLLSDHDDATATVVINAFTEIGLDAVVGDRRAWINAPTNFLLNRMAYALPPERVVLELLEDQHVDDQLIEVVDDLRSRGFTIALDDFVWDEQRLPLLGHVDIVKVETLARRAEDIAAEVDQLRGSGVTLLAEKVETREQYDELASLGFDLFQGYFFCTPQMVSAPGVAPGKHALLQLIAAVQDPQIEFSALEALIVRDIALSYRLLRYINSAFFGLRREVGSISHALALLGLDNVKRWATLTIFAGVDVTPREVLTTALVRARFCELAGGAFGETNVDQLFTLGLFSVVDALMDAPMDEVLRSIPFPEDMRAALIQRAGSKGRLLDAALACERGEFTTPGLGEAQLEAIAWADDAMAHLFDAADAAPVSA